MVKPALHFSWNRNLVWGLLLLAATLLAYRPAWNGQPVWDDDAHMTKPELRSAAGLACIWTHPGVTSQYYPLVHTVFWVEHRLFGDATPGYHLLNILLHVISALLLVRILRRLGIPGEAAWLAGWIFALHPVMVESVAWISELKNTLSGVFFMSAALAYLTYTDAGKRRWYMLSLGLFLLGLLSKTTIVPFPLAMLVIVWWKRGRILLRRDIVPLLPFVLAGILLGLITIYMEHTFGGTRGREFSFSFIERCLIAGRAIWFYLGKVFLPVNLMLPYPRWVLSAAVWWQYLFPVAAVLVGCILWAVRKVWRTPAALFFYFTAMLLPCLGFISLYTFRYSFVADHYQYLAAIGPMAAASASIVQGTGVLKKGLRRIVLPLLCGILLLVLFLLSWKQSGMYSDAETLYRMTLTRNDNCWMAHYNLGLLLADKGRTDEAMVHYQKTLELNPNIIEAHNNLGLLLADKGRTDEAIAHYQKALELNPNYAETHNNLGLLLADKGRTDEAMAHYQKALELNPIFSKAHNNLGLLLADKGRTDEAIAHFQKALELNPNYAEAHTNLGILLGQFGRTGEAIAHYQKVLELNPNNAEIHNNLGLLFANMGQTDNAMVHFLKALEINPDYVDAHYNLGILLTLIGRTYEAMAHYQKVLELNHNHAEAHNNLGILLAQVGRSDEAIAHFRKALEINSDAIDPLQNLVFVLVQKGQWTNATSVLKRALASAKSVGDEARAKAIEQFFAKLNETIGSSQVNSKAHAQ